MKKPRVEVGYGLHYRERKGFRLHKRTVMAIRTEYDDLHQSIELLRLGNNVP